MFVPATTNIKTIIFNIFIFLLYMLLLFYTNKSLIILRFLFLFYTEFTVTYCVCDTNLRIYLIL